MAGKKYPDLTFKDFKGYDSVPPAKESWAAKALRQYLASGETKAFGMEFDTEEETKSRLNAFTRARRENPKEFEGKVAIKRRGNGVYVQRMV